MSTIEEVKEKKVTVKQELDAFKTEVTQGFASILAEIKNLKEAPTAAKEVKAVVEDAGPTPGDSVPVPPTWRALVTQILGPDFEVRRQDMASGEIKCHIIVPREKSNADQLHWERLKEDVRTVIAKNGERSVKEWCIKVRNNLLAANKTLVQYP